MSAPLPTPRLDVYSIRLFIAAAEEGSMARAAERENIAASALSRRIADLEHALGVPLLIRSARGITLTDAGRHLHERGARMELELQSLAQEVATLGGRVAGTVRLHANASSIVGFLPERLHAFSQDHPDVVVELHENTSREVVRACLDDRADVGVAVGMDVSRGLDAWPFAEDPLLVVMPAGHPLARQPHGLRLADLLPHGLVGIQPGGALDQLVREQSARGQAALRFRVSVNSFDAACRMVEAGLGIAIVPTSAAAAYAGSTRFERRPLAEAWAARQLRVLALQKQPRPRSTAALIAALRR